jgi:hypothetical protein
MIEPSGFSMEAEFGMLNAGVRVWKWPFGFRLSVDSRRSRGGALAALPRIIAIAVATGTAESEA